ncbi:hypothetical protein AB6A40_004810 [Gnathostoma spinigerum]|uniref:Target of Myb protein 1 n=1 Tax=Gnathostoma spinigerum TaxID=75299 RepID=A0ABD6EL12_9BILA
MSGMQEQVSSAVETAKEAAAQVGERVSDFFQGNPFATPVGRKIEMATDASLPSENWGLNMEICDYINNTADGGRDALRAIRKRLYSQMSKNNAIVMYTLTVLETCVKNCDTRFHELVCQKEFINELVKLIGPKFDAPQIIQERVLCMIQSWADAFRDNPRLAGVCQVYDEYKAKGVEFPMTDFDSLAPIITPKRTVFPVQSRQQQQTPQVASADQCGGRVAGVVHYAEPSHPVQPTTQQLEKLRKELDIVTVNVKVLREMLAELVPGEETPEEFQLLQELHNVCKQMQQRISELARAVDNDEVTYELLVMNDEFFNVFEKYDRYMTNRKADRTNVTGAAQTDSAKGGSDLIQLEEEGGTSLANQLGALEIHGAATSKPITKTEAEYAENSTRLDQTSMGLSTAVKNKQAVVSENEASEMSRWLEAQKSDNEEKSSSKDPISHADAGL